MKDRLRLAFAGLHPDQLRQLLARVGSPTELVRAIQRGRVEVGPAAAAAVSVEADQRLAELDSLGATAVLRGAPEYPSHLASLPDAPDVLFVRGTLPDAPQVALVGSRQASGYGLGLATAMGAALAAAGWPVVSGLARGIDGAAHRGVLAAGGIGSAVVGCGLDVWYPVEHRALAEQLAAGGGAVVSEYPPGARPEPWRFPPRNRIISGLARIVVVVEAAVDGGALITARRAVEQNRDVFAVPGDVDRLTSVGCNLLIRDGALPVLGPEDLVQAVSLVMGPPVHSIPEVPAGVLAALAGAGRSIDDLAEVTGLEVRSLLVEITRLEAAGRVRFLEGMVVAT